MPTLFPYTTLFRSEQGRAENESGEQLPDHARLTQSLHDLAESAPDQQKQGDLRDKDRFAGPGWCIAGAARCFFRRGERGGGDQDRCGREPGRRDVLLHAVAATRGRAFSWSETSGDSDVGGVPTDAMMRVTASLRLVTTSHPVAATALR